MKIIPVNQSTVEVFLEDRHFVIPPEGLELPASTAERILKEKPGEFVKVSNSHKSEVK